jgi:D-alanine-D-alanine ligase
LGKSQEITPARISKEEQKAVEDIAVKVYKILNMQGISRSEFILVNGVPHFLEMNTVPGLSEASIFPQQILASGDTLTNFFTKLIEVNL